MAISDSDDLNQREYARVIGIGLVAAVRGGVFTTRQQRRLDQIADKAQKREDKKRAEQAKRKK